MIDYLQGLLAGRDDGIKVNVRLLAEKAMTFSTTLVSVDNVGIIVKDVGKSTAHPWAAIRKIEVRDNAL